jgi:hypothetical protein
MKKLICLLLTTHVFFTYSQNQEICGYQNEISRLMVKNPKYLNWQDNYINQAISILLEQNSAKRRTIIADTISFEIPVVVHVLYNKPSENIADSIILNQIEVLNKAFNKLNSDTSIIRNIFKHLAANVKVKFALVDKDTLGNPHSGINRIATSQTTFAMNQSGVYTNFMKHSDKGGADAWNTNKYMNIWICNMKYPNSFSIVYGFATPPTGAPNWDNTGDVTKDTDDPETGVVLHYTIVGNNNPQAPNKYNKGISAVHEVGHFLGLRHTWGDGDASTGCTRDDGIYDTPNARYSNATCSGQNTCVEGTDDLPDQTENYMDYALDGCAAMFTKQQAAVMQFVLLNFRNELSKMNVHYDTLRELKGLSVFVYPNPSFNNAYINVKISDDFNETYSIEIISMDGKKALDLDGIKGNSTIALDRTTLGRANYYLIIRNKNKQVVHHQHIMVF